MASHLNKHAEVTLVGGATKTASYGVTDLRAAFRDQFLDSHIVPIQEAVIEQTPPGHFLAHLRHRMLYHFETVKFELENGNVVRVERHHDMKGDSSPESFPITADEEYGAPTFFVGTPVPGIKTAMAMVDMVFGYAQQKGYNPVKVTGPAANIATYKKYLQAGLKGFVSVGHGSTQGILLADGTLSYKWLQGLSKTALRPEVVYLNSCQVFNAPFGPAVLGHGARTFVGGVTNLAIGPSEQVSEKFWHAELIGRDPPMGATLHALNAEIPQAGTFGIGGDMGSF